MQFGHADWPFLPNDFKCVQTVWLFIKMSDWPFLRNTINMYKFVFIRWKSWQNFKIVKNLENLWYFRRVRKKVWKDFEEILTKLWEKFYKTFGKLGRNFEKIRRIMKRNLGKFLSNSRRICVVEKLQKSPGNIWRILKKMGQNFGIMEGIFG